MPIDWEKADALRREKFDKRNGGTGTEGFEEKLKEFGERLGIRPMTYQAYRFRVERARGIKTGEKKRANSGHPYGYRDDTAGRIYLEQAEALAYALDVPLVDLMVSSSRDDSFERGKRAGYHEAMAEISRFTHERLVETAD